MLARAVPRDYVHETLRRGNSAARCGKAAMCRQQG